MSCHRDHYDAYYADKLWNLMPAVYRSLDTDQFTTFGPLREMVNRIGAQAAIMRRSIDRMWQDQSVETCDDWIIPYIADILATRLAPNLDPPRQRLDVAKTIYYRRRKGTVALIEELSSNITGWDAKVVEFFRRMGRTRHGLDPAIGLSQSPDDGTYQLQIAEGLVGPLTKTPIGGTARLTCPYGAGKTQTAFDEFFHTADFRRGIGQVGWQNIPHLGIFLWRLKSFLTGPVTPVNVQNCPSWFTFDPTGRDIPLFALASRDSQYYTSQWASPEEAQLPTSISQALLDSELPAQTSSLLQQPSICGNSAPKYPLYPSSLAVFPTATPDSTAAALPLSNLTLRPEKGRVQISASPLEPVWTQYSYGFASTTGAGPYSRRAVRPQPANPGASVPISGGLAGLTSAGAIPSSGTVTIGDSLTYNGASDVDAIADLTLQSKDGTRPLIRFQTTASGWTEWSITGNGDIALALDGLFASGADIVLRGTFDSVTITCCTFDPGSAAEDDDNISSSPPPGIFTIAADGQALVPSRLWIEASINTLTIQRSILGPVRTRLNGEVENLTITDTIIQGIRTTHGAKFEISDVKDPTRLIQILSIADDPVSKYLVSLAPSLQLQSPPLSPSETEIQTLVDSLNGLISGGSLYDPVAFAHVSLSYATRQLLAQAALSSAAISALNHSLLEDAYPLELADAALALADGTVTLSHCTVLGRTTVHRLEASECILNDIAAVDDTQNGCVRFTAISKSSVLPRQYECVDINPGAELFVSTDFGQPGYAQLQTAADLQISDHGQTNASTQAPTILSGAENGSEMGAFYLESNSIKERALLFKCQEYMPAALVPILVYLT